ncbi:MAG: hypothetical protein Q7U54_14595 [Bacteroidales bacterium]|nr:hypothetical protein [Bacteroidales bacterium]
MKKIVILVQVIGLTLLMACKSGGSGNISSLDQPYGEESGIVTYKPINRMGVKLTLTMYFDDYGKKERRETVVAGDMNGMVLRQHTIDIRDGNVMYHYEIENNIGGKDMAKKNVYKTNLTPDMYEQMNVGTLSKKLKKQLDFKDEGKETVAGLAGIKYSVVPDSANPTNRVTRVHYKNIPIKVTTGQMEIIADKVDFDANVPAEKFALPAGYNVVNQPTQQMPQAPAEAPAEEEKK